MGGETIWRRFRRKAAARARVLPQAVLAKFGDSAPDTKEAEALAATLNHSAERVQTLWFSFLIFMVYLDKRQRQGCAIIAATPPAQRRQQIVHCTNCAN